MCTYTKFEPYVSVVNRYLEVVQNKHNRRVNALTVTHSETRSETHSATHSETHTHCMSSEIQKEQALLFYVTATDRCYFLRKLIVAI